MNDQGIHGRREELLRDFHEQRLQNIHEQLLRPPEGSSFGPDADMTQYYQPWGFAIYRTTYSPESDQRWLTLLDRIRSQVRQQVWGPDDLLQDDPVAQQVMDLFRLDVRSDSDALNGLEVEQVRQLYKDSVGGKPIDMDDSRRRQFLLVDDEVLAAEPGDGPWVKCVDADYMAADYAAKHARVPQRYFGWMKMTTRSLVELWELLVFRDLNAVASPQTIGGLHLVTWDGD